MGFIILLFITFLVICVCATITKHDENPPNVANNNMNKLQNNNYRDNDCDEDFWVNPESPMHATFMEHYDELR